MSPIARVITANSRVYHSGNGPDGQSSENLGMRESRSEPDLKPTLCFRFKKGQKLCADGHLQVLHKDTKHSVFIPKVCEADAGLYVAQAQNSSGTLSSKAILHVTGNHGPPITRLNWIMLCIIYVSVSVIYWLLTR